VVPLARYPQLAHKDEISLSDVTVEALETSLYDAKVNTVVHTSMAVYSYMTLMVTIDPSLKYSRA
jgi:hypothetical protein